jgi:hypothetical protein
LGLAVQGGVRRHLATEAGTSFFVQHFVRPVLVADASIESDAKIVRINLRMESGMMNAIDAAASACKLTRSACLAQAARHEIERWAPPHNTADDFASALWLWYGAFPKT